MNQLEQKLYDENVRLYQEAKSPLRSHGPDHHFRVYENAKKLAAKIGIEYDSEVLAGAALFHDLAAYYPEETGVAYHDHDHVKAREALVRVQFPTEKLEATVEAIKNHGSDPKYKQAQESVETRLLRDADKLDAFGPIGCARIVMVRTLNGDALEDIVADFWTNGHLERKWQSITYPETRAIGQEGYEYSRAFFRSLSETLESPLYLATGISQ